ncbi:hypothetical protein [Streptomyces sp. NPDC005408]|uniref:hypothetical protein n=1 Tax=Streptomyces sp. NPDC005408 TaxID=3155341 RepID=UPI0033A5B9C1
MSEKATSRIALRRRAFAGTGAVALLICLPPAATAATAAEPGAGEEGCPVTATAQGVQVMVSASDNTLLQAPTGVGVPVAQACVDHGVEESTGFAANPYPGETVVSAPALIGSQTGQSIPGYPAYATSRYPSATNAESGQQGHTLSSHSDKDSTRAQARTWLGQEGAASGETTALATAAVDPVRRVSSASATSDTQPMTLNGVLRLGRIRSLATAKVGADGKLVRDSQLTVGRTEVAGQVVEITTDGVRAVGQKGPALPGGDPAKALEAAGVRVRYLGAEQSGRGVTSAAVEVLVRQQDTQSGAVYTVHYTFGGAFAAAAPVEQPPGGGADLPPVEAPPPAAGGVGGDAGTPLEPQDPAPGGQPGEEPPAPGDNAAAPPKDPSSAGLIGNPVDMGLTGLYLVVAFAAGATFAFGTLLRLLGVRTRWTS